MADRISLEQMAMQIATAAAARSEDPFRQVGACGLTEEGRVIGVSYNGLLAKHQVEEDFWSNRDARQKYMLHAEQNLCSLTTRSELHSVAVTVSPCLPCAQLLIAHGVKNIWYSEEYQKNGLDSSFEAVEDLCSLYRINLHKVVCNT